MNELAIDGGTPVRTEFLKYSTQHLDEDDRKAVEEVLLGDWLTTGPYVKGFEAALAEYTGSKNVVAVNTGTAALHCATNAAGFGPGDEVIVPTISFVASANCVLYQGARPVFADVSPDTLNIDPADIEKKITSRTRGIVCVDFTGHPCDHDAIRELAAKHQLIVIDDAAHAIGATYKGRHVGDLQDISTFSFHPVKHVTTGEGGAVLTNNEHFAKAVRSFRHHGINLDLHARNNWEYDVTTLGFNYRVPDINCALGTSQLKKLPGSLARRRALVELYKAKLANLEMLQCPIERSDCSSAWHLYVVRLNLDLITVERAQVFAALRAENIGVNVHYIPIPWMTNFAKLGYTRGQWSTAESEYKRILSLPLYPEMTERDVDDVVEALHKIWRRYRR
jgi:perosamine synthetase